MNKELAAIKDAMSKATGDGRNIEKARQLADKYVAANPAQFTQLQSMCIHDCVKAVEVFREAKMEDDEWKIEVWLLHHFEPQHVGGPAKANIRVPGQVK